MVSKYSFKGFEFDVKDGIATVRLNRPDKLNALTSESYAELGRMTFEVREDDNVKAIIITGTGKGFCAGGDVQEIMEPLVDADSDELIAFNRMAGRVTKGLLGMRKPVISAVNGFAAGAGGSYRTCQ